MPMNGGMGTEAMASMSDEILMKAIAMRDSGIALEEIALELGVAAEELAAYFAQADAG